MTNQNIPTAALPPASPLPATLEKISRAAHLVKWFGDPILRTPCAPIPLDELTAPSTRALASDLVTTLSQLRQSLGLGRGLAAPQIGIAKRIIVTFLDDTFQVYINPEIVDRSAASGLYPEMCLSAMPLSANVIRPWEIRVTYYDLDGSRRIISASPILSRILQHEIDHLDGILFTDRADPRTIRFVDDFDTYLKHSTLTKIEPA